MPALNPEDQERLLGPVDTWKCEKCSREVCRGYCRECDEFYFTCECRVNEHQGHRTY